MAWSFNPSRIFLKDGFLWQFVTALNSQRLQIIKDAQHRPHSISHATCTNEESGGKLANVCKHKQKSNPVSTYISTWNP